MPDPDPDVPPVAVVWLSLGRQATALGRVAVPLATIADETSLARDTLDSALTELGSLGLVSTWSHDGSEVATLTPLAAARLGLKLRRSGDEGGGLSWMPLGARDPRERRRARTVRTATDVGFRSLDSLPGDAPRPDQIAEASEAAAALAPRPGRKLADAATDPNRLPRPTVLLTGCQAWERPPGGRAWHCPACHGAPITSPMVYCLVCDRWGLDFLLDRIWRAERRAEASRRQAREDRAAGSLAQRRAGAVA